MEVTPISNITITRAENTSALADFYCGIKSMDKFIHDKDNGLDKHVKLGLTNLWLAQHDNKIIGFFSLSKSKLILCSYDKGPLDKQGLHIEDDIFKNKDSFPSIEIDYFAINKDYRRQGIGSFLINAICQKVLQDTLSATMFLTVEALDTSDYSAVGFYRKCDFKLSEWGLTRNDNKKRNKEEPTTALMYKPLLKFI